MNAADIMIANVITVDPDTSVADTADLLLKHRISGMPVVDKTGQLVGLVSEGDLLRRAETGTERRRSWWLELFASSETLAAEYVKAHGRKVADVMTRHVVTAREDTPLSEIADLLERHHIKRVPIVRGTKVVGIVSRANLLQAFATLRGKAAEVSTDDRTIRDNILTQLDKAPWSKPWGLNITVQDGVVDVWGAVTTPEEKDAIRVLVEATPGVRSAKDNLHIQKVMSGI